MLGIGGGSAAAMPGTLKTVAPATPSTPIGILFNTVPYPRGRDFGVRGCAERNQPRRNRSVLTGAAACHFLEPADPVLHRRVRGEQLRDPFARPERAGDHQVRLVGE